MKTAGELSAEAGRDTTRYDAMEVGEAMVQDIEGQVWECVGRHKDQFDSSQFCVTMLLAKEPLIKNLIRRKFYAFPFLPKPRPNQTVWLYDKRKETLEMLWCLPESDTMAGLASLVVVDKVFKNMKRWSDSFFRETFFEDVRKEHNIKLLSEKEHLKRIAEEDPKPLTQDLSPLPSNPLDTLKRDAQELHDA